MSPLAALRSILAAVVVYGLVLGLAGLAGSPFDPATNVSPITLLVILGSLLGSAGGVAAGAWQARTAGCRAPALGLLLPAVVLVVLGVLITNDNGHGLGQGNVFIFAAHPLGALAGAVLYGRRWLAGMA